MGVERVLTGGHARHYKWKLFCWQDEATHWRYRVEVQVPLLGHSELSYHYLILPQEEHWLAKAYEAYFSYLQEWEWQALEAVPVTFARCLAVKEGKPYSLFGVEGWQKESEEPLTRLFLLWQDLLFQQAGDPHFPVPLLPIEQEEWRAEPLLSPMKAKELFLPPPWRKQVFQEDQHSQKVLFPGEGLLRPLPPQVVEATLTPTLPHFYHLLLAEEQARYQESLHLWRTYAPPLPLYQEELSSTYQEAEPTFSTFLALVPWASPHLPPEETLSDILRPWLAQGEACPNLALLPLDMAFLLGRRGKADQRFLLLHLVEEGLCSPSLKAREELVQEVSKGLRTPYLAQDLPRLSEGPAFRFLEALLPYRDEFTEEELCWIVGGVLHLLLRRTCLPPPPPGGDTFYSGAPAPLLTPLGKFLYLDALREKVGPISLARFLLTLSEEEELAASLLKGLVEHSEYLPLPMGWWRPLLEEALRSEVV